MMGSRPLADTEEVRDLLEIVGQLWPEQDPTLHSRHRSAQGSQAQEFAVLPSVKRPRLLVPTHQAGAAATAMADFSDALTTRQTLQRAAAWAALRFGGAQMVPAQLTVGGGDSIMDYLQVELGQMLSAAIGIGTRRANRKPVLRLVDRRGRLIGYAKVGLNPLVRELVHQEHENLRLIDDCEWRAIRPPSVLHYGWWRGHNVLVISALPTPPRPWGKRQGTAPRNAADEVARCLGVTTARLADSGFVARLSQGIADLRDEATRTSLTGLLEDWMIRDGALGVTMGSWHGDFTSWNMARAQGRLSVWDWEQFQVGVPVGLDRIHFAVNAETSKRGISRESVAGGLAAASGGHGRPDDRLLATAYLAAIAVRYARGNEQDAGSVLARPVAVMREMFEQSMEVA